MTTAVTLEIEGNIGYLILAGNPSGKPPTLDHDVLTKLEDCLDQVSAEADRLRALVVQSQSEKYFVVGANINALQDLDSGTIVAWVQHGHKVFNQLEKLPLPVIAKVEGYALGGGLELAMACDFILASTNAKFGQTEAKLGFVAGWGGSYRLPARIGLARAKEMFFSGKIISAEQAYEMGLLNFVGDSADLETYLATLLQEISQCSPLAISWQKQLLNASSTMNIKDCGLHEAVASSACLASEETQIRVAAFLNKR